MERCVGTIQRRSRRRFKSDAEERAKFANNRNELGWETLAQRRFIARICAFIQGVNQGTVLESDRK